MQFYKSFLQNENIYRISVVIGLIIMLVLVLSSSHSILAMLESLVTETQEYYACMCLRPLKQVFRNACQLAQDGCCLAFSVGFPLLGSKHRKHVHRSFSLAAQMLESIESPLARLRAQLHLEVNIPLPRNLGECSFFSLPFRVPFSNIRQT